MPLEYPQQLGLSLKRHLAEFVEKQRAVVGLLKPTDVVLVRSGKCSFDVTKKLALHQIRRNRSTIDTQHRSVGTRTRSMDRPGDELFAGTALAAYENRSRCPGNPYDLLLQFHHRRALTEQLVEFSRATLEPVVMDLQHLRFPHPDNRGG